MGRPRDFLTGVWELITSTIEGTYNLIGTLISTFGPIFAACPQIVLVIAALYVIPLLAFYFSDYAIILTVTPATFIISILNICITIFNVVAPKVLPLYALYYNTLIKIYLLVIKAVYRYMCPGNFPPTDFNNDCPGVVRLVTFVTGFIDAVLKMVTVVIKIIVQALSGLGAIGQQGVVGHQRAVCDNVMCDGDAWDNTMSQFITWLSDAIEWFFNVIFPEIMALYGFIADFAILIITNLLAFILQRLQFMIAIFGGLIKLIVPHSSSSIPNKSNDPAGYDVTMLSAVTYLQNTTLTYYGTGSPELRSIYLGILQFFNDIIVGIYDLVVGTMQLVDNGQCRLTPKYIGPCLIGNTCKAVFNSVKLPLFCDQLGRDLGICIDFSQILLTQCLNAFGYKCACDWCAVNNVVFSWIMTKSPCNFKVIDPVTNMRCCYDGFSILKLIAELTSGYT